jgi:hypothetical protein
MTNMVKFGAARLAAAAVLLFGFGAPAGAGQAFFWHGVRSAVWNDGIQGGASNWYSKAPPNGDPVADPFGRETARFAPNALRKRVTFSDSVTIRTMLFYPNVEQYRFTLKGNSVNIGGGGIINNAAVTPIFDVNLEAELKFSGAARIVANGAGRGALIRTRDSARVKFVGTSNGGNADIDNTESGVTVFGNKSSAASMFITNNGEKAKILFYDHSTAGRAALINTMGTLKFDTAGPNGDRAITSGSISNAGNMQVVSERLSVTGQLTLRTTGMLTVDYYDVGAKTEVVRPIIVDGDVRLAGTFKIIRDVAASVRRFTVIHGRRARVGKFSKVAFSEALRRRNARLVYQGSDVVVLLDRAARKVGQAARR